MGAGVAPHGRREPLGQERKADLDLGVDRPATYDDIQEHFKYGSIGSEPGVSLLSPVGGALPPYWVLSALPSICSDKAPNGYAGFGFVVERFGLFQHITRLVHHSMTALGFERLGVHSAQHLIYRGALRHAGQGAAE